MSIGAGAEQTPHVLRAPQPRSFYEDSFNLAHEFPKDRPFTAWDIGCGDGAEVGKLAHLYPGIMILGIDKTRYPGRISPVPIIHERIENIDAVVRQAREQGAFPPDFILARNSLYYFHENGLNIGRAFDGLGTLLKGNPNTKMLVFDNMQNQTYSHYLELCARLGLQTEVLPVGRKTTGKYIRISAGTPHA